MIWVLLGILLFGTGGSESILSSIDEVQARVSEVVEDDERRTSIETALEQFKADFGRAGEGLAAAEQGFVADLRRKDSTRDEVMAHVLGARETRRRIQVEMLDLREALRYLLTEDEWRHVFPAPPAD